MSINIVEHDKRLYLEIIPTGAEFIRRIDLTAHIERAVGNVLSGPLRELIDSQLFASLPGDTFGKKSNVD